MGTFYSCVLHSNEIECIKVNTLTDIKVNTLKRTTNIKAYPLRRTKNIDFKQYNVILITI